MPKKRGPEPPPSIAGTAPAAELAAADADALAVLAELGSSAAYVQLYRLDGAKRAYIETLAATEFSIESIRDEYGGGTYQARILNDARKYQTAATFAIDRRFRGRADPAAGITPPAISAEVEQLKELVKQQSATLVELVKGIGATREKQADPMELALRISELLQRERQSVAAPAGPAPVDVLALLERGMELQERLGAGRPAAQSDFAEVLRTVGRPIARALEQKLDAEQRAMEQRRVMLSNGHAPRTPPPDPAAQLEPAAQPTLPPGAPTVLPQPLPRWLAELQPLLPLILAKARAAADPAVYAPVLVAELSDEGLSEFAYLATLPGYAVSVLDLVPALAAYRPWFLRLFAEMLHGIEPESDAAEHPAVTTAANAAAASAGADECKSVGVA